MVNSRGDEFIGKRNCWIVSKNKFNWMITIGGLADRETRFPRFRLIIEGLILRRLEHSRLDVASSSGC